MAAPHGLDPQITGDELPPAQVPVLVRELRPLLAANQERIPLDDAAAVTAMGLGVSVAEDGEAATLLGADASRDEALPEQPDLPAQGVDEPSVAPVVRQA